MSSLASPKISINRQKSSFRRQLIIIFGLLLLAAWLTFSQFFGESRDYSNYEMFFQHVLSDRCQNTEKFRFELGFQYFSCLLAFAVPSPLGIYSIIAVLFLFPKLCIMALVATRNSLKIAKIPVSFMLALFMYTTRFFPLHELTQLRISVGMSFILVSFFYIKRYQFLPTLRDRFLSLRGHDSSKWNLKSHFAPALFLIVGILFHSSLLISTPFLLMQNFVKSRKFILSSSIIIFLFLLFLSNAIANFTFANIALGEAYKEGFGQGINLLSAQKLLDWCLATIGFLLIDPKDKLSLSILCLFTYSIPVFYGFSNFPVLAHRFSEIFQVFGILLVASMGSRKQLVFVSPFAIVYSLANLWVFTTSGYFF